MGGRRLKADHETLCRALALSNLVAIHEKTGIGTLSAYCGAVSAGAGAGAGILGYHMYQNGQEFKSGDGIVMKDIESTIRGIGLLGKDGMKETNNEIIRLMVGEERC